MLSQRQERTPSHFYDGRSVASARPFDYARGYERHDERMYRDPRNDRDYRVANIASHYRTLHPREVLTIRRDADAGVTEAAL